MKPGELHLQVMKILDELKITYILVSSFSSGAAHGYPQWWIKDIKIVLELQEDQLAAFCRAFPSPNYDVNLEAAREAVRQRRQFNVIHNESGNIIDFMIARDDAWGHFQMARRLKVSLASDDTIYVADCEDFILWKLIYYQEDGSESHLRDITMLLQIHLTEMDTDYISNWAEKFGLSEIWEAVLTRVKTEWENDKRRFL